LVFFAWAVEALPSGLAAALSSLLVGLLYWHVGTRRPPPAGDAEP
jgi:hypothetical protein